MGCQGGCKRIGEVFGKIQKKNLGGEGGRGGVGSDQGLGWGRGVARFGVGGDVVYGDVNQE